MKKLTLIPVALLVCAGAYGQGTIAFSDSSTTKITVVGGPANGAAPSGAAGYRVDLFYQIDNSGSTAPAPITALGLNAAGLGNWAEFGAVSPAGPTGEYLNGKITLSGIAGGANVWVEVVGFNNSATSYVNAGSVASYFGNTSVIALTTADPAVPTQQPPTLASNPAFTGLVLTPIGPEPTTMALGALGAASLLAFRRRK
jgi:hypothetical protein